MTTYPEHDKQALVVDQTQAIGDFLEWLASEGVQLMIWREDMTDSRVTDRDCLKKLDPHALLPCDQPRQDGGDYIDWRHSHCLHWQDETRPAEGDAEQGHCCRCGKGRFYEVTGLKTWSHERRSINELLADWAGIDLAKIEAEKRAMLAKIRADAEAER